MEHCKLAIFHSDFTLYLYNYNISFGDYQNFRILTRFHHGRIWSSVTGSPRNLDASENAAATPVLWPFEIGKRYERALNFGGILCSCKPFGSHVSKKTVYELYMVVIQLVTKS